MSPRPRLPEDQVKDSFPLRLPRWLIKWLESKGNPRVAAVKILLDAYKREKGD